jgi:hypothetical protein
MPVHLAVRRRIERGEDRDERPQEAEPGPERPAHVPLREEVQEHRHGGEERVLLREEGEPEEREDHRQRRPAREGVEAADGQEEGQHVDAPHGRPRLEEPRAGGDSGERESELARAAETPQEEIQDEEQAQSRQRGEEARGQERRSEEVMERPHERDEERGVVAVHERVLAQREEVAPALAQELHHHEDAALAVVPAVGRVEKRVGLVRQPRQGVPEHAREGNEQHAAHAIFDSGHWSPRAYYAR